MVHAALKASEQDAISIAHDVLTIEAKAITDLIGRLDESFGRAVQMVLECRGRVVVSGIGKSGHIAHKIASTFASTGTPAFFVHPAEASHGDLGMVTRDDVFIGLSNSGESAEILAIVPLLKRQGAKLIALTGNAGSSLAKEADVHLYAGA
ncbi:MAG TPA: SIS domain-containing protein, partial [Burkholderiales bacterium]|nr:SIS domain-containing protein [Burkholderiales bacterium]